MDEKEEDAVNLTSDQQNALDAIGRWMKVPASEEWMFFLGGFAGTGKTTLMHFFINSLEVSPTCLAPTGKAAAVLQKRLDNAVVTTIHSALYKPVEPDIKKLENLIARLQTQPGNEALIKEVREEKRRLSELKLNFTHNEMHTIAAGELVIVDEASMVSMRMMSDLEATGAKVLFVGDPGQLPPVGDVGFFTTNRPDAMLTQVMRQALDNPIVALSMHIRQGKGRPTNVTGFNEAIILRERQGFDLEEFRQYDQLITGKNVIRRKLNRIARKQAGVEEGTIFPVAGEKLICLKNTHKFDSYFVNGVQCLSTGAADVNKYGDWCFDILYEGSEFEKVPVYHYPFESHYRPSEEDPWAARKHLMELDYGYAITAHKSQGSEWDNVALIDDGLMADNREFRKRWLYTAVTRAKKKLLWVEMQ